MFKKVFKGLYVFALMLFTVGAGCLLPTLLSKKEVSSEEFVAFAESENGLASSNGNTYASAQSHWVDSFAGEDNRSITLKTDIFPGLSVYEITSPEDLALFAYNVNNGVYTSSNDIFVVTVDNLDLQGKLWTPIGTNANPFKGVFIGKGSYEGSILTISNLNISDSSVDSHTNSAVGLFGNVEGSVSNIIIDGKFFIDSNKSNKGKLVGALQSGAEVINCYDNVSSVSSSTATSISVNSIGASAAGSYVYQGKMTGNKDLTISGSATTGSANFTKLNNNSGVFMKGNVNWYEERIARFCVSSDSIVTTKNPIYNANIPMLREDVINENQVYPYFPGSKANIVELSDYTESNQYTVTLTFTKQTKAVVFNFQYGTRTNIELDMEYDQTLGNFMESYHNESLKKRVGYNFEGLFKDVDYRNAFNIDGYDYKNSFPTYSSVQTVYPKFTAKTEESELGSVTVKFLIGADDAELASASAGHNIDNVSQVANCGILTNDILSSRTLTLRGTTIGSDVTFRVTLSKGYEFNIDSIANAEDLTIGNYYLASKNSGLYVNFKNHTGIDSAELNTEYNYTTQTNNDDYSPAEIEASVVENANRENVYDITIKNVVGQNGEIYLVLRRVSYYLDLTPDFADGREVAYEWLGADGSNYVEKVTGEDGKETYRFRWVLNQEYSLRLNVTGEGAVLSCGDVGGFSEAIYENRIVDGFDYFRTWIWTVRIDQLLNTDEFKCLIGALKSKVVIELQDLSGNKIDTTKGHGLGLSASINNSAFTGGGIVFGDFRSSGNDFVTAHNNGYYQLSRLFVNGTSYELGFVKNANGALVADLNERVLNKIFDNTEDSIITIAIRCDVQKFEISPQIWVAPYEQKEVSSYSRITNYDNLLTIVVTYQDGSPVADLSNVPSGSSLRIVVTLKGLGKSILYGASDIAEPVEDKTGFITENGSITIGYEQGVYNIAASNSPDTAVWAYDVVTGTFNTEIRFKFNYKRVNLLIDKLALADGSTLDSLDVITAASSYLPFVFDNTNGVAKIDDNASFPGLSIHSQYYLLGWYLTGHGHVTTAENYNAGNDPTILADMLQVSEGQINTSTISYNNVMAFVAARTISVTLNAGEADKGDFYYNNAFRGTSLIVKNYKDANITYGQSLTIENNVIQNLGHTFDHWNVLFAGATPTPTLANGGDLRALGTNWYGHFGDPESGMKAWSGFASEEDKTRELELIAVWNIIEYQVLIDNNTQGMTITGSEDTTIIFSNNDNSKTGIATYQIKANGITATANTSPYKENGGYIAQSFNIVQRISDTEYTNRVSEILNYTFDAENAKSLLAPEYYFAVNPTSAPIIIETNRIPAPYRLYIDKSANNYYTVEWNEENDTNDYGGVDDNGIYINVTFDAVPENIQNAIDAKALVIDRPGYTRSGWARSNAGAQAAVFDATVDYTTSSDLHIVPIWAWKENTTKASLTWADDVGDTRTFRLFTSHNILNGWFDQTSKNVTADSQLVKDFILTNGDKVVDFGFEVTFNGKKIYAGDTLNINNFNKTGDYDVRFFISLVDSVNILSENRYEEYSDVLRFRMVQNEIFFYGYDLHTNYNGTNEFVPTREEGGINNNLGSFLYRFTWNGEDLGNKTDKTAVGTVENFFNNFSVYEASGNYNAGGNKSLKMYLKLDTFAIGNIYGTNYDELFANVVKDGDAYYVIINNDLTIEKAKFTITFTPGSAYYFEDVTTTVYVNTQPILFNVGSVYFTYNYSSITLPDKAQPGTYRGSQDNSVDRTNFVINGLVIEDHITDRDLNFEWNINKDSVFELKDSSTATLLEYTSRYLTAADGKINTTFDTEYNDISEEISISNIVVNGSAVPADGEQFSYQVNGEILFSYVNNNTSHFYIYINRDLLTRGTTLSFNVNIALTSIRLNSLSVLAWGTNNSPLSYENLFNDVFSATATTTVNVTASTTRTLTYAIMTDVVKLNLNYNGGNKASDEDVKEEIYYISALNGGFSIPNPIHPYAGLSFNSYSDITTLNISATKSGASTIFRTNKGGPVVNLKASWNFDRVVGSEVENQFTYFASTSGLPLALSDVATIEYPDFTTSTSYTLKFGERTFNYKDGTFTIANDAGMGVISLTGEYTLTVGVIYNDGVQNPQTREYVQTINVTININTIGIARENKNLTFNNRNQEDNISIAIRYNGKQNDELVKLSALPLGNNSGSGYGFYIEVNSIKGFTQINKVDTYTITAIIDSELTEVYALENNFTYVTVVVDKFVIKLHDYEDQIELSKIFGTQDPNPIKTTIVIAENNNDEVIIEFTREPNQEGIGAHKLYFSKISLEADDDNYRVDDTDFDDYFEIVVPQAKLQVRLAGKLQYVYNGYTLTNLTVTYNGTNYTITGMAGTEVVTTTFELYYMSGVTQVQIPEDQREAYASYLVFASSDADKDVNVYSYDVSFSEAQQDGWSGVEIVNLDNAQIVVNKRTITVTSVTKVFNQTKEFVYNNVNTTNNNAVLSINNIVSVDGSEDEVQVLGKFDSELAGRQTINSIVLTNEKALQNYTITYASDLKILVTPSTEEVKLTSNVDEVNYGIITDSTTIAQILSIIPHFYNNGVINNKYITTTRFAITDETYSNGHYLTVSQKDDHLWEIVYTLTSINYTFGQPVGAEGAVYTEEYRWYVEVLPLELTVNSSQNVITKQYDGYDTVLDLFVGQNVNAENGYYTATGILEGDIIEVVSAKYNDKTIANGKEITAVFGEDWKNYTITQNIKGNITSINLVVNKKLDTIAFADAEEGEKEFTNTGSLTIQYSGDLSAVISSILNETTFATRVGYDQIGWRYKDVNIADMTETQKEELLQDATDKRLSGGITIDAIWQIQTYKLTIVAGEHSETSITERTVSYFESISGITVTAKEGYTFEGLTLAPEANVRELKDVTGISTKNGSFALEHIVGNLTVTVNTEEITVKIIVDYNNPTNIVTLEKFVVDTLTPGWTGGVRERTLKYSELLAIDLPTLFVTTESTYDFLKWTLNDYENLGTNLWSRISGQNLTEDNEENGYTFVANWKEAELTITVNIGQHGNAKLYLVDKEDSSVETEIVPNGNVYTMHYNDIVKFEVESDDWYKWTGLDIQGRYVPYGEAEVKANNETNGTFTLKTISTSLVVNMTIDVIRVNFTTSYTMPVGTKEFDATNESGKITGVYYKGYNASKLSDSIRYYVLQTGTYFQDYWTSLEDDTITVTGDDGIENAIITLYKGIPTKDINIAVVAHFQGRTYTFYFDKGTPASGTASFVDEEEPVTRQYVYGERIGANGENLLPVVDADGQKYAWSNGTELFSNGSIFTTESPNAELEMYLCADWSYIDYEITLSFESTSANSDQLIKVQVDGNDYSLGDTVTAIFKTNKQFEISLKVGYELDPATTVILTDDHRPDYQAATISINGNTIVIRNVQGNITAAFGVKPKDYTITVEDSEYEDIPVTNFDVHYDQDLTTFFSAAGVKFEREGYTFTGFNVGANAYARVSGGTWTYNEPYASLVDGSYLYKNDGNLTLKAVWTANRNYITAVTQTAEGLHFNGAMQTIATTTLTTPNGESVVVGGQPFRNGDKVVDIYYMLNGSIYRDEYLVYNEETGTYSLLYRDVITDRDVYIVIALQDTLNDSGTTITYTIPSLQTKKITIAPSDINVEDASLVTYYSGTATFNAHEDNDFGIIKYDDGSLITELTLNRVEIVAKEVAEGADPYGIGNGYSVKFFYTASGDFKLENYFDELKREGNFYVWTTDVVTAEVVQTIITIDIAGMGFENGDKHEIVDYTITSPDYVRNFLVNVTKITTSDITFGEYSTHDTVEVTWTIKNGQVDRTENFTWAITGKYEIVDSRLAYKVNTHVNYFDVASITDKTDVNITILSYTYGETSGNISGTFYNHIVEDELIFSISSNGSNPLVQVLTGKTVTFVVSIDGTMAVLSWTKTAPTVEEMTTALNEIESEGSRNYSVTTDSATDVYVVLTDYKAVLLNLGDKGGDQGYVYVQLGSTTQAVISEESAWTGFAFERWDTEGSTVTADGTTITAASDALITTTSVTAIWRIEEPASLNPATSVERSAKPQYNADSDAIDTAHILVNGMSNRNDDALTYDFKWYRGTELVYDKEDGFTVIANTDSNDENYRLVITASREGYISKSTTFRFGLTINKLAFTGVAFDRTNVIYEHDDYVNNLFVNFAGEGYANLGDIVLADMLNKADELPYYFTMTGFSTTEMLNAGDYTLTLHLDEKIFEDYTFVQDIKVNRKEVIIAQNDLPADLQSKLFGMVEPTLSFTVTFFEESNPETITLNLVRTSGEGVGVYPFTQITTPSDDNFDVKFDNAGVNFTINPSSYTLSVKLDSKLTVEYYGFAPVLTTHFDEESGRWILTATSSRESSSSSFLTLSFIINGEPVLISGELYKLALDNLSFTIPTGIEVGDYSNNDFVVTALENANFTKFEFNGDLSITKLALVISNITKVFDRTNAITDDTIIAFANKVGNDDVSLSGTFNQITAGSSIGFTGLTLTGTKAGNYTISNPDFKGSITALAVENLTYTISKDSFVYGDISVRTSLEDLLALLGNIEVNIDGVTTDLGNNYIAPTSWTVENRYLSNAQYLIANRVQINIVFSSVNFSGLNENGYSVTLILDQKELDLSSISIIKNYDETVNMPKGLNTSLAGYILNGDDVSIDKDQSKYASADVQERIKVSLVLTGADKDNYKVLDNVYGTINEYTITFNVFANEEDEALVTDGKFVDDGLFANVRESAFAFKYPAVISAKEMLDRMTYPTRQGYRAVGWKYKEGENYITITSNNIFDLLKQIANDEENDACQIAIYTVWEIIDCDIVVQGDKLVDYSVTGELVTGSKESGYKATYFSDVEIYVKGERGYKITSYNVASGSCREKDLTDTGAISGTASLEKIDGDILFIAYFDEVQITFNLDVNIPMYTNGVDVLDTTHVFSYSTTATLTQENLPVLTVTAGTYTLDHYNYSGTINMEDKTLQEVVDILFAGEALDSDKTIVLKAIWKGETYTVNFNPGEGALEPNSPMTVVYGSEFESKLPVPTNPGRSHTWTAPDGTSYDDGENNVFHSIGRLLSGGYTITLEAKWTNNPYTLTLTFDEKLAISSYGKVVASGDQFVIVYSEDVLTLDILANRGYDFEISSADQAGFKGVVERPVGSNQIVFYNLVEDQTFNIRTVPVINDLSLGVTNVLGYTIKVDGKEYTEVTERLVQAYTESEVEITYTAVKGYEFDETSAVLRGDGKLSEPLFSANKKEMTIIWKEFFGDASLTVTAVPADNEVTIPDISAIFDRLNMNGTSIDVNGDVFKVKTGQILTITGALKYGYMNDGETPVLSTKTTVGGDINYINSQLTQWNNTEKLYTFTAELSGFDEAFVLEFVAIERSYSFVIKVKEGFENIGEVLSPASQTVKFNDKLILKENTLGDNYIFAGWEISGNIFTEDGDQELVLDATLKNVLESYPHDTTIEVFAVYKDKITSISFRAGNKGAYILTQEGIGRERKVNGGQTAIEDLNLGSDIIITLLPDDGYEIDKLLIDDVVANDDQYTYDAETLTLYIPVPINHPMSKVEITFKPSVANVYVQAGVQVNFEVGLGSNEGGKIYLSDERGNKVDETAYLPNGDVFVDGADYMIKSYTDASIYFVAEPKSGFSVVLQCLDARITFSEFDIGGKHVYCFSGVKNNIRIDAVFTAKENLVQLKYVVEGSTDTVIAGRIQVDTTSKLVRASGNNTQSVDVRAITGSNLSITLNSNMSYALAQGQDGRVSYYIDYPSDDRFDSVQAGLIEDSDTLITGYTNTSTLEIVNVNSPAIIYIYVQPKIYNLRFYVNENVSVTVSNLVVYGERFSLNSLTDEEKATILQEREGFTLGGYYTSVNGQGTRYVDREGNVDNRWFETGYDYDGSEYKLKTGFYNELTNTFTLYAAWLYNKSSISIEFVPEDFSGKLIDVNITNVITNISTTTSWTNQDDRWYAEVVSGSTLQIQAYEYEGYEFMYWLVSVDGGEPARRENEFSMTFPQGSYKIKAIYNPKFTIKSELIDNENVEGGISNLLQDGKTVTGTSYDPSQIITLEAIANEGYKFLYWINTETGDILTGETVGNKTTYTFENLVGDPLYLKAIFEGKTVLVNLDYSDVILHHEIYAVYLNGQEVDYSEAFEARIGDKLVIELTKSVGYGFEMLGGNFTESANEYGRVLLSYTLDFNDLVVIDEDTYGLNLVLKATREEVNLSFAVTVEDPVDQNEFTKAGSLKFTDASGRVDNVEPYKPYKVLFGDTVYLEFTSLANYRVVRVELNIDISHDISYMYEGGRIVIDENFMTRYFSKNIEIIIVCERLLWTNEEFRSKELLGSGTSEDPYLVTSEADFAYVAYLINNGESDGKYAEAHYRLTTDLDFAGKYWEPVGTEENPFKGVFDLGEYSIKNVVHYKDYTDPGTSFGGLFRYVDPSAQIIQSHTTLIITLSVIFGVLFLLILLLLLLLLLRKKKKEKLEKIASY